VVKVLNNAGVTDAEARTFVNDASKILDNAHASMNVRLQIMSVTTGVTDGDDGSGGGTAGDGVLTLRSVKRFGPPVPRTSRISVTRRE
jgi:hypothetical protein